MMHELTSQYETERAAKRVVLLGASNLSRSFPIVVRNAQRLLGSPLDVVVAKGYGRSYGKKTSFFGKKFCGIIESDLWNYLERKECAPTYALITDVGNDILYGVPVETIVQWIAESVHRLQKQGARIVMTDLPTGAMLRLGKVRFLLFRTLFYPSCRLSLETVAVRAEALSRSLKKLAEDEKVPIIKAKSQWYGWDPIHLRRSLAPAAWTEILGQWPGLLKTSVGDVSAASTPCSSRGFRRAGNFFGSIMRPARPSNIDPREGITIAQF